MLRKKTFLLKTFNLIENIYGSFGELGVDFALDKNLNIWFIECNAKPGKDTIYLTCDNKTIHRSFSNPLNYGKYLWETEAYDELIESNEKAFAYTPAIATTDS